MKSKKELIKAIKENEYIKEFLRLEKKINENKDLQQEMKNLHELQQQIVNLKNINKVNAAKLVEEEYWQTRNKLETHPTIRNYLILQEEINNLLQTIKDILEEGLNISET